MTRWGLFLLAAYIALGLSPRGAVRYAVLLTVTVVVGVAVKNGAL